VQAAKTLICEQHAVRVLKILGLTDLIEAVVSCDYTEPDFTCVGPGCASTKPFQCWTETRLPVLPRVSSTDRVNLLHAQQGLGTRRRHLRNTSVFRRRFCAQRARWQGLRLELGPLPRRRATRRSKRRMAAVHPLAGRAEAALARPVRGRTDAPRLCIELHFAFAHLAFANRTRQPTGL
jgi:hypothetical protein